MCTAGLDAMRSLGNAEPSDSSGASWNTMDLPQRELLLPKNRHRVRTRRQTSFCFALGDSR